MTLSAALQGLMRQTVTLSTVGSQDSYGAKTYGTAKTYKARVEQRQQLVKDQSGRDVLCQTVVYVGPTSTGGYPPLTLAPVLKIVLPDGTSPAILAVEESPDSAGGRHHSVVYCG